VWVADYRRYGMASLRQAIVMDLLQGVVWRPLRAMLRKVLQPKPAVETLPLRHSSKDGPR